MHFIVDANRGHCFRPGALTAEAKEILRRIEADRISIVTGGKNLAELSQTKFVRYIKEYRGGPIRIVDQALVTKEQQQVVSTLPLKSDDGHVIALARVANGRILFTDDALLIDDFTNNKILSKPPGRVFRRLGEHTHLLEQCRPRR